MKVILLALRSLSHFRLYAIINILGLALSLACVVILSRYIWQEITTDHFIQKLDRLYITTLQRKGDSKISFEGSDNINNEATFKDPLLDRAVEASTTFIPHSNDEITYNNKKYTATFFAVDTSFLKLFDYPLLVGNKKNLFNNPESAAITQEYAYKLFGKRNPIGEKITLSFGKQVTIEGIIGRPATQSSFNFDVLVSVQAQKYWLHSPQSIALFRQEADLSETNKRVGDFMYMWSWQGEIRYQFFPLKDLYFNTQIKHWDLYTPGNYNNIQVLFIVTLLILLVGLFNFINIYTVLTLKRGREFGMKKVFGANRKQLFSQLYIENFLLSALAVFIGWVFVELTSGAVESFLGLSQRAGIVFDVTFSACLLFLFPLATSLYPYIKFSYDKPITSLRSVNSGGYSILSRNTFLVVQYIISITLIILSVFFVKQLKFMLDTDPGYQTKDILQVKFIQDNTSHDDEESVYVKKLLEKFKQTETINQKLNESPLILQWVYGNSPYQFGETDIRFKKEGGELQPAYLYMYSNEQYFDLFQLQLVEGRKWDASIDDDMQHKVIINETAKKLLGITNIETDLLYTERPLRIMNDVNYNPPHEIIGVIKDFQVGHMAQATPPVILTYSKDGDMNSKVLIRCTPGKRKECIQYLKQVHDEIVGGEFSYTFIEDEIRQLYKEDKKITAVYSIFAIIAILISSLGLFSLSLFDIQQRFREIAIRKINGASVSVIMQMLLQKYYKLLAIAFILAAPISWLSIHKYLEGFAHKTTVSWWIFAIALFVTGSISLLTLIWQTRKAAYINPAKAIKSE
ncbi:ABC transporter permease [Parabacteroides sp. AM08-6]|uniref:ABC transporter permease n=1 Tax=Parabacteroides sp. AM08-6 TaxID=2292053 RepID=UPI000F009387|nr:ABC transporter permease [Parabacteroides sp. AM08-6]RHJ79586.1 ABC transporter permease [Parabacteroides sp. AM08-6]